MLKQTKKSLFYIIVFFFFALLSIQYFVLDCKCNMTSKGAVRWHYTHGRVQKLVHLNMAWAINSKNFWALLFCILESDLPNTYVVLLLQHLIPCDIVTFWRPNPRRPKIINVQHVQQALLLIKTVSNRINLNTHHKTAPRCFYIKY